MAYQLNSFILIVNLTTKPTIFVFLAHKKSVQSVALPVYITCTIHLSIMTDKIRAHVNIFNCVQNL